MASFELHVSQNGNWRRLDAFQNRGAAMSAAIGLEQARRFSALKILQKTHDEGQDTFSKKLIYSWSEDRERRVDEFDAEQDLERQRRERRRIQQNKEIEKQNIKEKRKNIIIIICMTVLVLISVASFAALRIIQFTR